MALQLRHSLAAVTIAALWSIVPALSALHLALEDHVYCAEHGALEERHEGHPGDAIAEPPGDRLQRPGAESSGSSHEICAHAELATRDEMVSPTLERSIVLAPIAGSIAAEPAAAPRSVSLLRLAPKNSPPTAA